MSSFSHPDRNGLAAPPAEQERALASALSAVPAAALIVADAQRRITHFNQGAEQLFGSSAAEVGGQPLGRLLPQLDEEQPAEGRPPVQRLLIGRRADGAALALRAEVARVELGDSRLLTVLIAPHQPERAPADLSGPSAQRVLLHAVQDAVIVTDPALRILDWNPAAEALYGWTAAEALGRVASELLPAEYEDTDVAQVREHFQAHGVWKGELTHRHRDGRALAIQATVAQVRGPAGELLGLITVNRDITARKRAEAELRAYAARLELLTEASRAFAESSQNYTALLEGVVHHIAETLGCLCTITLPSDDGRWLQPAAMHDVDPEALAFVHATLATTPLAADSQHPLALVFRGGQPRLLPAIDPQQMRVVIAPEYWPMLDRFRAHSSVMVPLRVRGQSIGVLGLARRQRNPQPFCEQDLQLIQNLADRAALAIENARLFAQAQRELAERQQTEDQLQLQAARLEILAQASRAFAEISLDYTALLERVVQHVAQTLDCACMIHLLSDDTRWLRLAAVHDMNPEALAFTRMIFTVAPLAVDSPHPLAQVFRSGQPRLLPAIDPAQLRSVLAPEYWPAVERFRVSSIAMAPLRVRGQMIGALGLARHRPSPQPFSEEDLRLIQNLADRAALAIENARLFAQAQHELAERQQAEAQLQLQAARLGILAQASRIFAEAGLDYTDLLARVVQHVGESLACVCALHVRSDDQQWLPQLAMHDADPGRSATMRVHFAGVPLAVASQHPVAQVFRGGQPRLVPAVDYELQRSLLAPEQWAVFERFPVRSEVMVPLLTQGERIGVLILLRFQREAPPFTEDDLHLAQDLAERAGLAITNARLFAQVQRELAERQRAEQALAAERAELARRVEERTADLSQANAELARAARLKDEFLATMSHELRTPLNSILGRAQLLQEAIYGPVAPEQVRALQGIEESGQHLLALINDILDLSKIETGKLDLERGEVDVELLCAMCLRMVKETATAKRIRLTTTLDGQVETLAADERRLRQILVNLLSNAVKFTSEGGEVGLEVRGDPERGTATFTVWDSGIGIAAEDLPKLFQPFMQIDSRLNRQYSGTGLGLALVLRLAQAHGGSVAVESAPGRGSRFCVTLPWSPAQQAHLSRRWSAPDAEAQPAQTHPAAHQPVRILLAEDNEANIAAITDYLTVKGYQVLLAYNGGEAVARAREQRPELILMDIQMPGMDGLEATRQIRADAALAHIPIIALTALAMPGDRERCLAAGASEYLTKPVSLRALLATIAAHLPAPPDTTHPPS